MKRASHSTCDQALVDRIVQLGAREPAFSRYDAPREWDAWERAACVLVVEARHWGDINKARAAADRLCGQPEPIAINMVAIVATSISLGFLEGA